LGGAPVPPTSVRYQEQYGRHGRYVTDGMLLCRPSSAGYAPTANAVTKGRVLPPRSQSLENSKAVASPIAE